MKTINEASIESAKEIVNKLFDKNGSNTSKHIRGFKSGVKFAQRWIPIEEEPIPYGTIVSAIQNLNVGIPFTAKIDSRNEKLYFYDPQDRNWFETDTKPTHWRPIELK